MTNDPSRYSSILDCITRMIHNEGYTHTHNLFSTAHTAIVCMCVYTHSPLSLYKGILPPVVADTPKRAAKVHMSSYRNRYTFILLVVVDVMTVCTIA